MRDETHGNAYFIPSGASGFTATQRVGGAWFEDEQHIAPLMGVLAHLVEADRDERGRDGLVVARLSYEILGRVKIEEVSTRVRVLRPGRSVELVEAAATQNGRDVLTLRAWLMQPADTQALAAMPLAPIPGPDGMEPWDPTEVWPGHFIDSVEVRRAQLEPGRARFWARTSVPLIAGVECSRLAYVAGLMDITNGMTVRANPNEVAFPNVDLTAHLFAQPEGEWIGFDTSVTFGTGGMGLTSSVIHDRRGPIGVMAQMLTVRQSGQSG